MKIKRTVNALPSRPSSDVWKIIIDLVTGDASVDAAHLTVIAGIVASVVTDEFPTNNPFVFYGVGPRLVIYCQYGMHSMDEENVDSLNWNPTAGDWRLAVPSDTANLTWLRNAFSAKSNRILVYDIVEGFEDTEENIANKNEDFEIDWKAGA